MTRSICALLLAVALAGCSQGAPGTASPAASPSELAVTSPTPEPSPTPSPSPTPAATPTPAASPTPAPTPTPKPWLTFESREFRYTIKYPPTWTATPATPGYTDTLDDSGATAIFIQRDTLPSGDSVSLKETANHEIASFKSHYDAKLLNEEVIPFKGGWKARIFRMTGYEDGLETYFQMLLVGKNRIGYFVEWRSVDDDRKADDALFKQIYSTFRPRT